MKNGEKDNRLKVLIADDNEAIRSEVVQMLEADFEIIAVCSDGQQFLDAEKGSAAQIGILDLSMPLVNGLEALRKIRAAGSELKVLILTVQEDCDYIEAAFDAGAEGYVVKKSMASDLLTALEKIEQGKCFVSPCCEYGPLL